MPTAMASVATAAATATAIGPSSTSATAPSATASSASAPTRTTVAIPLPLWTAGRDALRRVVPVEIGFIRGLLFEIAPAFDCHRRDWCSRFGRSFATTHLGALFLENRLARQADPVPFDGQHLHQHLVAFFEFVPDVLDPVLGDFADVQQAIGTGNDLHERAEVGESRYRPEIGFAYFGGGGQIANHLQRLCGGGFVVRGDIHFTGILDVDLHASLVNDAANHLSAGPDQIANLVDR